MSNLYSELINKYPVQKTLRFELKPVGKTLENIEKKGYISEGEKRAADYRIVKKIIDRYHVMYIEEALQNVHLDGLEEYMRLYCKKNRNDEENKKFSFIQGSLRKNIVTFLKEDVRYNDLFKENLIKNNLGRELTLSAEELEAVSNFKGFTTFFTGFHENRKNMYSEEEKSTAISYRLINQNLPKFVDNIIQFRKFSELDTGEIAAAEKYIETTIEKIKVKDCFDIDYFNFVLNQDGIEKYNYLIGELNKRINEFNQKLGKEKRSQKIGKLKMLYKQILSDRGDSPFSIEAYDDDETVIRDILAIEKQMVNCKINLNN